MKKIIVSMLLLIPVGLIAQEQKIAVVNTQEILNVMPEVSTMESELATLKQQYEKEKKAMDDEYMRKYSDLTAQGDSLTENIRMLRIQEIQDIQTRLENFVQMAQETLAKKQDELFIPIREKVQKAIKEVAEENGYTYMLEQGAMLYISESAINATEKVKAKLTK